MTERRRRHALLAQIAHSRDVAYPLCHLAPIRQQKLPVTPEARERFSRRAFGLGDLILVMRKYEIDSATMNVHRRAEVSHCHRGAFEMPAGSAATPWRIPRCPGLFIFRLRRFP